jgi:AraC family transcriptional regulator
MAQIVGIPLSDASGAEATWLAVGGSVERNVAPLSTGPTLRHSTSARLEYLLSQAVALSESDHGALWCCLNDALAILRGHLRGSAASTRRCGLMRWQTHLATEYINANLPSKVTLAQLANVVGISKCHFSRAFKVSVGIPPGAYVAMMRVERAKRMIRSTREPLCQVAVACGFADQAHLCRSFRRWVGVSPAMWRKSQPPGSKEGRLVAALSRTEPE